MKATLHFLAICTFLAFSQCASFEASAQTAKDLDLTIRNIRASFESHYALSDWKLARHGWQLDQQLQNLELLKGQSPIDPRVIRKELYRLMTSARDPHLKVGIESTERSTLPIHLRCLLQVGSRRRADLQCYIAWIQSDFAKIHPLAVGDEVLTANGLPIWEALHQIYPLIEGDNLLASVRIAESLMFDRQGFLGLTAETQPLKLKVRRTTSGPEFIVELPWIMDPEHVLRPPETSAADFKLSQSPYLRGDREGYLPDLGRRGLATPANSPFLSYVFEAHGKKFGFLRIPTFTVSQPDRLIEEYKRWIGILESSTDALILDLTNNPGGSVTFMHAVASLLTPRPLIATRFQRRLAADDVRRAHTQRLLTSKVTDDESARRALGPSVNGFPVTHNLVLSLLEEGQVYFQTWAQRLTLTPPTQLEGVKIIPPFPASEAERQRGQPTFYSKPILVVTDARTMSSAELLTAVLVDNQRAISVGLGPSTAGAGGIIREVRFPNEFGIHHLTLTEGLALRPNGQTIEETGVPAQVVYQESLQDLTNSYIPFRDFLLSLLAQGF